jgi:hypothetical protein
MCFLKGGKLMTAEESQKIGGFHRTERLFKKQTGGLLYNRELMEREETNDKETVR